MKLPLGKIPKEVLEGVILRNLGFKRKEVVLGPSAGFDGAVIERESQSIIVSMDPVTGAIEQIGWLTVNVNANDVATFGVEPAFFLSSILLPENSNRKTVEKISEQIDKAAKELRMAIVGGHCEVTPGLSNPIVVGCAIGVTEKGKYVTAGGAKGGDKLILTKSAGIEGTAILATDMSAQLEKALDPTVVQNAKKFYTQISIVKDALTAFKLGSVNAMHDPTEGGIFGGINEMADASKVGVKIIEEKIPIQPETISICRFFRIDPFQLISSGALLISANAKSANKIAEELDRREIQASIIGEFVQDQSDRIIIRRNGRIQALPTPTSDHLWLALLGK